MKLLMVSLLILSKTSVSANMLSSTGCHCTSSISCESTKLLINMAHNFLWPKEIYAVPRPTTHNINCMQNSEHISGD